MRYAGHLLWVARYGGEAFVLPSNRDSQAACMALRLHDGLASQLPERADQALYQCQ